MHVPNLVRVFDAGRFEYSAHPRPHGHHGGVPYPAARTWGDGVGHDRVADAQRATESAYPDTEMAQESVCVSAGFISATVLVAWRSALVPMDSVVVFITVCFSSLEHNN